MVLIASGLPRVNTQMYGGGMENRLSKTDWLDHGLRTLASAGPNALKAAPMAQALKVSRGSFYWHFDDIAAFERELLNHWRARLTLHIIDALEAEGTAETRLSLLMRRGFMVDHALERAIRFWAAESPLVAEAVAVVDAQRIDYTAKIFAEGGCDMEQSRSRATFLYWAYLGRIVVMDQRYASLAETEIQALGALLTT
jgi:AcrR family transcriptional regulator